jgi:hypothetical protein
MAGKESIMNFSLPYIMEVAYKKREMVNEESFECQLSFNAVGTASVRGWLNVERDEKKFFNIHLAYWIERVMKDFAPLFSFTLHIE